MRAVAAAKLTIQYCSGKVVAQRQASGGGVRVYTGMGAALFFKKGSWKGENALDLVLDQRTCSLTYYAQGRMHHARVV